MRKLILVGHLIKVFGKDGYLKLAKEKGYDDDLQSSRYLVVRKYGDNIPYFIDHLDLDNELVKFESISNPESAKFLSDSPVYLFESDVSIKQRAQIQDEQMLKGFSVTNQYSDFIGEVLDVVKMPMQILLKVDYKGNHVLIPFHETLIVGIDLASKSIQVEITDGLLEL